MPKIAVGAQFPDMEFETFRGEHSTVKQAIASQKLTVFWLMRFIGCRFCQYDLDLLAEKNLMLTEKMRHMARRTTREKLLSYLSAQALRAGTAEFDIPLDRQQLADFLAVDRSAMSAALGKLRDEGVLEFRKNHFRLLRREVD